MKRRDVVTKSRLFELAIIVSAALLTLCPLPSRLVERYYSRGLYPRLQSLITPLTNSLPFSLLDVLTIGLLAGVVIWWILRLRSPKGGRWKTLAAMFLHTAALAAVVVLAFHLLWGLNYRKEPLSSRLDYDDQRVGTDAIKQLKRLATERLNAEVAPLRNDPWPEEAVWRGQLEKTFKETLFELGGTVFAPAVPKTSILNPYLQGAGIAGFTNPFGHEVIFDSALLPFEKPFLLGHEWAHLAGFADEAEAGFVGLLACLRSGLGAVRYSGWLALYDHTPWPAGDEPRPALAPEVVADLRAISDRIKKFESERLSKAQSRLYDRFLKANRVEAGIESYGLLVRLVLGTRYESEWIPARRRF